MFQARGHTLGWLEHVIQELNLPYQISRLLWSTSTIRSLVSFFELELLGGCGMHAYVFNLAMC